jgi:diguanylate cyclase (GGDEF)-like protein
MKTYNTYYSNISSLRDYIAVNKIPNNQNVLIQVFTGICYFEYINTLLKDIKSLLPEAKIIGSSTDGEIMYANVSDKKTVLSISVFEKTKLVTYASNNKQNSQDTANEIIKHLNKDSLPKLLITFADGMNTNGQEYVKAFEKYDESLVVAGGLAGDNAKFRKTFVFTQDGITDKGAVAVGLYGDDLVVNSSYNFGWESIGCLLKVTKSKDNIVYTIDDMPAAQVYKKYLGLDVYNKLPSTGIEFPLIIKNKSIDIARAALVKNDDDSLVFAGNVDEGETVQFGFGNIQDIINHRFEMVNKILQTPSESIFIYSCMARKYLLENSTAIEIEPLNKIAPVSGFFTYGEIFHNFQTGHNNFLNQTMTAVSISESKKQNAGISMDETYNADDVTTVKALCHLASTSSKELHELNENLEKIVSEKTYELRVKNKELLKRYYYDGLTSLGNRNLLIKEIGEAPQKYSLISIDINNFKNINDLYGLNNGDEILKQFAKLLTKIKQHNYCKVYRVSGDEFAILNKKPQNDYCIDFISYLIKSIDKNDFYIYFNNEKIAIDLGVTIGIANRTTNLIEKAHLALIQAKEENEKYKVYESDLKLEEDIIYNVEYTKIIKDAIKNGNVVVYFQAIFKDDSVHKYETLMRINHNGRIVSPFEFLDIAKKNGDYLDLTKIIIEKSFKIFHTRDKQFSINLSFEDIRNKAIVEYIKEKLEEYDVKNQLIIEILEDESIKNYELVKSFVHEMKKFGIKIALDDFGSGYSNFARVLELNVDYIKIDGSIISNIDTNENSYLIAQTITEFSKKLGIKTIAEYIHSEDVYVKAKELGIDEFQGFLLAEPKPL